VSLNDLDTILTEKGGRRFEWTTNADASTRNALYFATKEGRGDDILHAIPYGRQLYLFGEESTEVWYNTGVAGAGRYQRLAGGVIDQGLKSRKLVVRFDRGIFLIGDDDVAYMIVGQGFSPVSTPSVNTDLAEATPTNVSYYEDRGHKFCSIRFDDRPAWVYDMTTQLWHRRTTGMAGGPWAVTETTSLGGSFYGATVNGTIERLTRNNADVGEPLKRTVVSKPLFFDGKKFSVQKLQFLCRMGTSDLGRDAQVMMRTSWDGGFTWSVEETASLGDLGDYGQQAEFRALGRGEQFAAEFAITDPADIQIYSDAVVEVR